MKRSKATLLKDTMAVCITALFAYGAAFTGALLLPRDAESVNMRSVAAPSAIVAEPDHTFVS